MFQFLEEIYIHTVSPYVASGCSWSNSYIFSENFFVCLSLVKIYCIFTYYDELVSLPSEKRPRANNKREKNTYIPAGSSIYDNDGLPRMTQPRSKEMRHLKGSPWPDLFWTLTWPCPEALHRHRHHHMSHEVLNHSGDLGIDFMAGFKGYFSPFRVGHDRISCVGSAGDEDPFL